MIEKEDILLRLEEVAVRLGCSYPQVRIMVLNEGKIPYVKVGVRGKRVKESDLRAYIAGQGGKSEDTKQPYKGRRILQPSTERAKEPRAEPPGDKREDS